MTTGLFAPDFLQWLVDQNETATGKAATLLGAVMADIGKEPGVHLPRPSDEATLQRLGWAIANPANTPQAKQAALAALARNFGRD